MKRIVYSIIAVCLISTAFAQDDQPAVSLVSAATIAENYLASLKLSEDHFLRSIALEASATDSPKYVVHFEPPLTRRSIDDKSPERTYRVITVTMNGLATIDNRVEAPIRAIRRTEVRPAE